MRSGLIRKATADGARRDEQPTPAHRAAAEVALDVEGVTALSPPVSEAQRAAGVALHESAEAASHESDAGRAASAWWRHVAARSETWTLLSWMLVAFLLRFLFVWNFEHVISPDGVSYVTLGRNLLGGDFRHGLSTYYPPLYPLLVGLSTLLFRDAELAGRMVSVVAGSLLVVPVYRLTRDWYGVRVARFGAALVALHPLLIYYSTVLLTEATYTLLFTCGVLAGWSALSTGRARAYMLAGTLFGACYLLKPEACGFILLLGVAACGVKFFKTGVTYKSVVANASALVAGFLLLALPYLIYLRRATGAWMLSGKFAGHLWQGTRATGDVALPPATLIPDMTTALVQLTKALRYEFEVFNLIFPTAFVVLAGLGLFRTAWTRARAWRELYLAAFIAATLAGYAVTLPNIRFLIPLLPLLLCWVSKGVVEFEGWTVNTLGRLPTAARIVSPARRLVVPLVVAALVVSLLPLFVYLRSGDKWHDYHGQKRAAVWIKEQTAGRAPVIMSTVPVAAFYAGGRHVPLVDEAYATLIERARHERVDYIIVNERNVKNMSLRTLLDEHVQRPELRPAHSLANAPGHKVLVYALTNSGAGYGEGMPSLEAR